MDGVWDGTDGTRRGERGSQRPVGEMASGRAGSRTLGAAVDPSSDQLAEHVLRAGRRLAAAARLPSPGDQLILRQVVVQQFQIAAAVALRVLDLAADLTHRLSFPGHFDRREAPARMTGDALKRRLLAGENVDVAVHVAGATGIARNAAAV